MDPFTLICSEIRRLLQQKPTVLVAIDGNSTAGKTTLAVRLSREFSCNVFHMDEFFLQSHQRTPERLTQPGGNVDYERFAEEVLTPLLEGRPVCYRPFDCGTRSLQEPVHVPVRQLAIIEGTYSCHPRFRKPYDLTVFLTVSPEVQRQRVLQRPAFKHRMFFDVWIPMEQTYFSTFGIREHCDLVCELEEEVCD